MDEAKRFLQELPVIDGSPLMAPQIIGETGMKLLIEFGHDTKEALGELIKREREAQRDDDPEMVEFWVGVQKFLIIRKYMFINSLAI